MGFNYGYEKKKFDSRWKRLEVEYCDAGMSEEQIAAMKEYDWAWFCSQRVFQNHTQPIPCEQYDEVCGQSQLFRKFASLSYQWDVDNFLCSVCAKWLRVLYRYPLTFLTVSGIVNEAYRKHRKYKATPHNAIKEKSGEQPTMQK